MKTRVLVLIAFVLVLVPLLSACAPAAAPTAVPTARPTAAPTVVPTAAPTAVPAKKQLSVVLINNFMGNSWRPIMERSAQLLAEEPPLEGRIKSLRIINTDNNAAAQNAALASAVLDKPDMILFIAASATGSNQAIEQACAAGITVVTFDNPATAPCAWVLAPDWFAHGQVQAKWLMNTIGGKGKIFMDLGLEGASAAAEYVDGINSILKDYPDVEVVTYWAKFSAGDEKAAIAALLPAHPDVDGILNLAYGSYAWEAMEEAGLKPVPLASFSYSEGMKACAASDVPCLMASSPTWVSASAMILGMEVIDGVRTGKPGVERVIQPYFVSNDVPVETDFPVYDLKESAVDVADGIILPLSPPWVELDLEEVLKPPVIN